MLALLRFPYSLSLPSFSFLLLLSACAGPHATQETAPPASPPQAAALPETITFQADVAPIRALAASDGFLWIGSDRGLRRLHLPLGPTEWVGAESGLPGRRVSALAIDNGGGVLVATETEIGRLADANGRFRYASLAKVAAATRVAPLTGAGANQGIWAGSAAGLFFVDGRGSVSPIAVAGDHAAVTSLEADGDGKTAWVGVAGHGLFQVDAGKMLASFGPQAADPLDFVDCVGTALLPNGTRMAAGRGANGASRMLLLRRSGAELLAIDDNVSIVALVEPARAGGPIDGGPWLLAGAPGAPRLYALEVAERGRVAEAGVLRFTPTRKNLQGLRLAARPDARVLPPEVTVAIAVSGDRAAPGASRANGRGSRPPGAGTIVVGTRSVGVARLSADAHGDVPRDLPTLSPTVLPTFLPSGELALEARSLSVACLAQERCVFATGSGPGWIWDGGDRAIKPIPNGAIGGALMALAGDGRSHVYFVAAGSGKSIRIARLSSDGARWEPMMELPVRVDGTPVVTFATLSPEGNMWMTVRDRLPSGQEVGRGVIEMQLPAGHAIHHRPYQKGEPRAPEAIPVAGDVTAVRFQKGTGAADPQAVWLCTSLGVLRFLGGQLSQWGEDDGLDSETCNDLEIAPDGAIWVATAGGVARFDGKGWRRFDAASGATARIPGRAVGSPRRWPVNGDGENLAARALVISGQGLWAGTTRGLWLVSNWGNGSAHGNDQSPSFPIDHSSRHGALADDDVADLMTDRFGRLWVLGRVGLTIRRPLSATPN